MRRLLIAGRSIALTLMALGFFGASVSQAQNNSLTQIDPEVWKLCGTSRSCEESLQRFSDLTFADMVNQRCRFIQRSAQTDKLLDGVQNELTLTQGRFTRQIPSDILKENVIRPLTEKARLTFCGPDQRQMVQTTFERRGR